jgi:cardiolipin synthase
MAKSPPLSQRNAMPQRIWTAPNILSVYRLAASPVIAACIMRGSARWFAILLAVSLLTDIADGWIARKFNLGTAFGARLDSAADLVTFLLGICGVLRFQWPLVSQPARAGAFLVFLGFYAVLILTGMVRFGKQPSLHTYSFKIAAYLQGACILSVFAVGFNDVFYFFVLGWSILACAEEIVILLVLKEPRSDVKGLYWVLKE